MSLIDKILKVVADNIKVNDKILNLSENVKDLAQEVRSMNERLIRIETMIEIAQNNKLSVIHKKELPTIVNE